MDLKQIKELMAAMEKAKIKRIKVRTEKGAEVVLEREGHDWAPHPRHHHPEEHLAHHFPHHAPPPPRHTPEESPKAASADEEGNFVLSPMVGTFYASPSPDDPHFVKVGDTVQADTVVCIIEAMKVMNEVKAGVSGKVAEILVQNGHPVEFGTKMIRIV